MQIYKGTDKCDTAKDTYITRQPVIKHGPVDIGVTEFFQDEYQYRSGISEEICRHDKETDITANPEAGDEPIEKDSLEGQVGNIQA